MVCGESGIGKSSFAELFMKKFNLKDFLDKLESQVRRQPESQ